MDEITSLSKELHKLPLAYFLLIEISFILILTILFSLALYIIFRKGYPRLKNSERLWDDIFLFAANRPLQVIIWAVGITLIIETVANSLPQVSISRAVMMVRELVITVGMVWIVARYIRYFEERIVYVKGAQITGFERAKAFAIGKWLRVGIAALAGLMLLQIFGIPITGLLAFGGASAVVVGLAARDILSNFFGGLMVYTDQPFTVGDWICSPDQDIEGTVEKIGWRLTRVRRFDQRPIYVPNATFSSITIENPSRMTNRRIYAIFGLRYQDVNKIPDIVEALKNMLDEHPDIDPQQITFVRFFRYAAYSLDIQIYTFTKTTAWLKFMQVQEDVFLKVADIVHAHGAQFAFPTQTVEVPNGVAFNQLPQH